MTNSSLACNYSDKIPYYRIEGRIALPGGVHGKFKIWLYENQTHEIV